MAITNNNVWTPCCSGKACCFYNLEVLVSSSKHHGFKKSTFVIKCISLMLHFLWLFYTINKAFLPKLAIQLQGQKRTYQIWDILKASGLLSITIHCQWLLPKSLNHHSSNGKEWCPLKIKFLLKNPYFKQKLDTPYQNSVFSKNYWHMCVQTPI